jgi:uncharacterized protein (TIGR00730 family)
MGKRICVYCSSSNVLENKYIEAAQCFAKAASLHNYTVVCGGSNKGLMGIIIDTMLAADAQVEGVVPVFMKELEFHHPDLVNIEVVSSMSRRKDLLRKDTDAVVAFPGGMGTLEEFIETLTLKRLGIYSGDVIIYNQEGFYDPLLSLFEHFEEKKVLNRNWRDVLMIANNVDDVISYIETGKRKLLEPMHYAPEN